MSTAFSSSAFGIVHKSFKKLQPKLGYARMYDEKTREHRTMDEKLRRHAMEQRQNAGAQGLGYLRRLAPEARDKMLNGPFRAKYSKPGTRHDVLRQQKTAAHGMYDAISRLNRSKRVLP